MQKTCSILVRVWVAQIHSLGDLLEMKLKNELKQSFQQFLFLHRSFDNKFEDIIKSFLHLFAVQSLLWGHGNFVS